MPNVEDRYLALLKKSLLNQLYFDNELRIQYLLDCILEGNSFESDVFLDIIAQREKDLAQLRQWRSMGWTNNDRLSRVAYSRTMLGEKRLDNIDQCIRDVVERGVPGDLIECGVWRGGGTIFMKGVLASLGDQARNVWVADSFQGLPKPSTQEDRLLDLSREICPHLAVSRLDVEEAFRSYELLDERVRFLEGWFSETLPTAPIECLAVLRLDGDLYESTMDIFHALYDRVSSGGYIIVDDYSVPACRQAVADFREEKKIEDRMIEIDWTGVYWQKSGLPNSIS
jgi:hypothetical protein